MAFTRSTLQRVGAQNDNSPTLWTYATADALTTVDTVGYFSTATAPEKSAADLLKVGDFIFVKGATSGISVVDTNTRDLTATPPVSGIVDTKNFTQIGAIDSD